MTPEDMVKHLYKDLTVKQCAIRGRDGAIYTQPRPVRHFTLIREAIKAGEEKPITQDMQGFLLSDGRFARRKVALMVALDSGQVTKDKLINKNTLLSEDLW